MSKCVLLGIAAQLNKLNRGRGLKVFTPEGQALFQKRKGRLAGGPLVEKVKRDIFARKNYGKLWHYQRFAVRDGQLAKEDV
jgi:hypothetical protein